ncbi:MAG: efflux RND transporter periplasmic adaptor subunit [Candidatus Zixiibacteriota bacterium]
MKAPPKILAILIAALSVTSHGCGRATGDVAKENVVTVATSAPNRENIRQSTKIVGHIEPWEDVIVYSKVGGYLDWIGVDRGSWVKPGELLARVSDPETERELERVTAESRAKKLVYDRLEATREQNPDMVRQLDLDRAKGEHEAAVAAQGRLEQLCSYSEIRAPFAGVVTQRWVDPGALIQIATSSQAPTARIVRMMRIDSLRVVVEVPERDAHYVRQGQTASVRVPDFSDESIEGRVARYSWAIDPMTRTMTAEIDLGNSDRRLLAGMYASVEITLEERPDALLVPSSAIEVTKEQSYVWIVTDGRAARVPVVVGNDDGINSEITGGLAGNELVVTQGRDRLREGIAVSIVENTGAAN